MSSLLQIPSFSTVVLAILATPVLLHVWYLITKPGPGPARTLTLPGPAAWPIVGNLYQLGPNWSETFRHWKARYGEVYAVRLGDRDVVVINSPRAAKELFIEQGSAYISRPWYYTFHNVLSGGGSSAFTIGTSAWDESCKNRRRAAATALNKPCVQTYTPIIEVEALALLKDLKDHGANGTKSIDPYRYFQRLALNTSLVVNYGTRMADINNEMFKEIAEVTHKVAGVRAVTGSLQDYIPFLRLYSKGAKLFSKNAKNAEAASLSARRQVYMDKLLDDLKHRIATNTDIPCITGNILRDPENKLQRKEIMSICMSMVSAGLDTFANTMIWTAGLLAQRPDLQAAAYRDLLAAHAGGAPDPYAEKAPYVRALVKEATRYFNVFRLSLPRATVADTEWRGHKIPKGTTAFLNAWACNIDAEMFADPLAFRPERYMGAGAGAGAEGAEGEVDASMGVSTYSFGVGRRMCPGIHLAMREMYVTLCYLVYFFTIERAPGEAGGMGDDYDIHPVSAVANPGGFSMSPKRYKVRFVPRPQHLKALEQLLSNEKFADGAGLEAEA